MTKTFKQIREQDYSWAPSMRQKHRGGSKGKFDLLPKRHSRDSTSGSLTDKQIQNLKKTWNNPSKVFTKDAEQFVKNMVKKLDNDSRHRLAKAGIKHISKLAESKIDNVKKLQEANWSISPEKQKEVNKFLVKSTGGSMHQDVKLVMKKFGLSKSKAQDMVFNWMSSWSPDKRLSAWGPKDMPEEVRGSLFKKGAKVKYVGDNPRYKGKTGTVANVHGTEDNVKYAITGILKGTLAITVGTADIQSEEAPANVTGTAVAGTGDDSSTVVVRKKKKQQSKLLRRIKDSIDKALPNPVKEEDEITTRKKQLKELAKNRNV